MNRTTLAAVTLATIGVLGTAPAALASGGPGGGGGGGGGSSSPSSCQPLQMPVTTGHSGGHFVVNMPVTVTNCLKLPESFVLTVIVNRPGDPEFLYTLDTKGAVLEPSNSLTIVAPDLKPVAPLPPVTSLPTGNIPETITATLTETAPVPQVLSTIAASVTIPSGFVIGA